MKPAPFEYHAPESVAEAVQLLERYGNEARPLAGGQSLVPLMALRLAGFEHLVDLGRIDSLAGIREDGAELVIGAGTRQRALERSPVVAERAPMLASATRLIGSFQIRNRGTIGGSLAHADPAAEYPAVAVALDGTLSLAGASGTRTLAADGLFQFPYTTTLAPDELIVELRLPVRQVGEGQAIREVTRRSGDFALAGCAARVVLENTGRGIALARVVLFGLAGRPIRLPAVEAALISTGDPSAVEVDDALLEEVDGLSPADDALASRWYRKQVAGHIARLAIGEAHAHAERGRAQ